ncbi:hypothetical protein [Bufonid herpesvirus 1]|uniref:hypothetical protein n=1 Tax=Bufonid herpesvirus 1 TaxID=2282206 RepID=UPI000EB61FFB|nr:hypothetical protein [Bufonid herpesvirus 1]AXF48598.1 hypothetical protein [Bufonid herpesvirus 1]
MSWSGDIKSALISVSNSEQSSESSCGSPPPVHPSCNILLTYNRAPSFETSISEETKQLVSKRMPVCLRAALTDQRVALDHKKVLFSVWAHLKTVYAQRPDLLAVKFYELSRNSLIIKNNEDLIKILELRRRLHLPNVTGTKFDKTFTASIPNSSMLYVHKSGHKRCIVPKCTLKCNKRVLYETQTCRLIWFAFVTAAKVRNLNTGLDNEYFPWTKNTKALF